MRDKNYIAEKLHDNSIAEFESDQVCQTGQATTEQKLLTILV